jgi:tetratricopeptide (TPR) repeat protein
LEIRRSLGDKKGISESLNNLGNLYKNQGKIEEAEKLYLESLEIKRSLVDKKGISNSLNSLGILYKDQGKIEDAEKLYLESLEIRRSLGDKKGISSSLNNLGVLYKKQGRIEDAEKLFLESLEIRRSLVDKKGISMSLNNLGVLEIEKNAIQKAKQYFIESIELKKAISDSSLLPAIHRAFAYFNNEERAIYFTWAMELDNSQFSRKEKFWAEDIQLMNLCFEISVLDIDTIRAICKKIIDLAIDYKLEDPDDLPIETFIIVSKKLISQSEFDIPKELCNQALEWIGDRKTIMKKKIQEILL